MPCIEYPFSAPCNGRATPRSNGPCVSQDLGSLEHYRARPVDSLISARLGVVRNTSSLEQALMESCHDTSNHLPTALPLLRLWSAGIQAALATRKSARSACILPTGLEHPLATFAPGLGSPRAPSAPGLTECSAGSEPSADSPRSDPHIAIPVGSLA